MSMQGTYGTPIFLSQNIREVHLQKKKNIQEVGGKLTVKSFNKDCRHLVAKAVSKFWELKDTTSSDPK